jgi:hypothetical protein
MATFNITTAIPSARLDQARRGQVPFTVTNTAGRDLAARARVVVEGGAQAGWFTLAEPQRDSPKDSTQQFTVQLAVPVAAAPGTYRFRLDVLGVEDPDEDAAEGPWTVVDVPPIVQPRRIPWRWVAVAAAAVVVLAVVVYLVFIRHPSQLGLAATVTRFGTVQLGQGSPSGVVTVTNNGNRPTNVNAVVRGMNPRDFRIVANSCAVGLQLPAGETCKILVAFEPVSDGERLAVLDVADGTGASAPELALTGTGRTALLLTTDPPSVALSSAASSPTQVTLRNSGGGVVRISGVRLDDPSSAFRITSACDGVALAFGQTCRVTVQLQAPGSSTSVLQARLLVTDDLSGSPQVVPVASYPSAFGLPRA